MAKLNNKRFVLGMEPIPEWTEMFSKRGRIKFVYDDELNLMYAIIQSPTGPKKANIGDTIVRANSGLIIIPKGRVRAEVKK